MEKIFFVIILIIIIFVILGLISQKGSAKGLVDGRLAEPGHSPNVVSSEEDVQPERAVAPLSANIAQIKSAILSTGGVITSESQDYISATYMSKIFKFVDDVELRRVSDNVWHIRSASRVGYSDNGANRRRVKTIRSAL